MGVRRWAKPDKGGAESDKKDKGLGDKGHWDGRTCLSLPVSCPYVPCPLRYATSDGALPKRRRKLRENARLSLNPTASATAATEL